MSVYNHRPMVPTTQNRLLELLDNVRTEFEQLTQDAIVCKSQRDEFEMKMNSQIQEMGHIQQSLLDLEHAQQLMKKQYEEEITRLRQQLEQHGQHISTGSPSYNNTGATNGYVQPPPPMLDSNPPPHTMYSNGPPPPPPSASHGPPPHPLTGSPYANGSPSNTSPQTVVAPPTPVQRTPSNAVVKTGAGPPMQHGDLPSTSTTSTTTTTTTTGFSEMDPETIPANMKVEGPDWFALFNPKVQRYLKVDLLHTFDHGSVVCCVKFSADGRYLAAGCNQATYIYDTTNAARVAVLQDESTGRDTDLYIRSVSFSPDGKHLATGAEDKQIRIWDIGKKRIRRILQGHEQDIYSLEFSRDGSILVSGSGDRTVKIWDWADGRCLHTLRIKEQDQRDPGVTSVAISPDGRFVAAGSLDKIVRVWDATTGQQLERLEGHKDSVYSVAFMPDGKTLVSGSLDKTLRLWQLGTNNNAFRQVFTGHKDFVLSVATTPDGNWIVSGSKDRGVQFWDPRTGQTQFMLQGHKNSVISVAASPGRRPLFATGSGDNRARIWSFEPVNA
ncbi:WD40-repeat-containing domain protein [Halteromyces radiatus]|uniref:WD40-repeat-containing domain protein n=1 Tax=Halteromyces radiatus TaxID=101107 RepID=UPI002220E3E8|nr:WD40-repeat-containing domain protein [Halteromyces radiatus]KAI8098462.1 WD40-repeat-containing domain protein [Halteromyces radiatus]